MRNETIKNGVIVMTALPPTNGHLALIEFASEFLKTMNDGRYECGRLAVIVNARSFEPAIGHATRDGYIKMALHRLGITYNVEVFYDECDDAPQNPSEHPDFWNWWKDRIDLVLKEGFSFNELRPGDYLFASEPYGFQLAEAMGLEFVPFDMAREIVPTRATSFRTNPIEHYDSIIRELQPYFVQRVVIFGAESCGKSTMTKRLQREFLGARGQQLVTSFPEWARPYLEAVGSSVTEAKMETIMRGQHAMMQRVSYFSPTPFVVYDTDLLSTLGYYRLCQMDPHPDLELLLDNAPRALYIVMNSSIPFEADPLRYGGDKRQSSDQFWIDLLEEKQHDYHVVKNTDPELQFQEVKLVMTEYYMSRHKQLTSFVRT